MYQPRSLDDGVLYRVVRDHFETFRAQAASVRDGEGLPRFVEQAFHDFLRCGWLAGGFARFRCAGCGLDRLVAFSCKGRAVCPSCGGRRMAERAAHLVDQVFPDVPVRQWVLSLPYRLRYLLAWDHDLCRAVAGVLAHAVFGVLRERARDAGLEAGRGGGVVVIQRFGGALNLNVHFHALVLDGVFAPTDGGTLAFHQVGRLTTLEVEEVLATVERLIARRLRRRGLAADEEETGETDAWADEAPVLAGLAAASVQGIVGLGPRRGARPDRLGASRESAEPPPGPCHARANSFSLHAALVVPAGQRERLERVCRYILRAPVAVERLHLTDDGQVRLSLRQPWRDGTTDVVFDPVEFLGRLAVLVPRPRINLLLYYGVLGARSAWRADVVTADRSGGARLGPTVLEASEAHAPGGVAVGADRARGQQWAALMQRTFGFDVLACPRCGGRLRLVALIEAASVIGRILRHLGVPAEIPPPRPARAPPSGECVADVGDSSDLVFTPCS